MCQFLSNLFTPVPEDVGQWYIKSFQEISYGFQSIGIELACRDDFYWFVDEDTWISWIIEAFQSAPSYQSITREQRGYDCDKFARHLCDHVATKYLCNGCFEVWGYTTFGYHAWNIILTPSGAFEVEPQNGEIWAIGTNPDYRIKTVYHAD